MSNSGFEDIIYHINQILIDNRQKSIENKNEAIKDYLSTKLKSMSTTPEDIANDINSRVDNNEASDADYELLSIIQVVFEL
jgi:hypothetical protein